MNDQTIPASGIASSVASLIEPVAEWLAPAGWLLFLMAMALLILIWRGRVVQQFTSSAVWILLTGMAVILTSPPLQPLLLIAGMVVAALQLRAPRNRPQLWQTGRRDRHEPWDQEGALLRMCGGDRAAVERLIRHEMQRNPSLSRAGAAMAAATRLRHER
jgi:uncharacterized protein HemY